MGEMLIRLNPKEQRVIDNLLAANLKQWEESDRYVYLNNLTDASMAKLAREETKNERITENHVHKRRIGGFGKLLRGDGSPPKPKVRKANGHDVEQAYVARLVEVEGRMAQLEGRINTMHGLFNDMHEKLQSRLSTLITSHDRLYVAAKHNKFHTL